MRCGPPASAARCASQPPRLRRAPVEDSAAAGTSIALGTAGAGFGATTVNLKGGLGSASAVTRDGHAVGALVAVNACGKVNVGNGPHFWAGPYEVEREFGGHGFPAAVPPAALAPVAKGRPGESTTIAIVATDAALTKAQAKELAIMAQDQAVLVAIPGIGKKLAERIIFELKEKVTAAGVSVAGAAAGGEVAGEGEIVAALQALGYSLAEAREASRAALSEVGVGSTLEERVKAALRSLLRE